MKGLTRKQHCHPERAQRVEGPAFAFVFAIAREIKI